MPRPTFTSVSQWTPAARLPSSSVGAFRSLAFDACVPALLPRHGVSLPAGRTWLAPGGGGGGGALNTAHLAPHASCALPMELSAPGTFVRREAVPLSFFLSYLAAATAGAGPTSSPRLYIAQAPLPLLPPALRSDFPTPELVLAAGRGDVYGSSLWLGLPPTSTPLHRDPNPNLFVQVAGTKTVRLLPPDVGSAVLAGVREGLDAAPASGEPVRGGTMRGEEMMLGEERDRMEAAVWEGPCPSEAALEATMDAGDALFIPMGWWHAIRGTGGAINMSANWWFR